MKKLLFVSLLLPFTIQAQIISTIAGNGAGTATTWAFNNCTGSYNGDGGQATSASLNNPNSIAVDADGNLYIADGCNQRIRKVNTSGIISTIAGIGGTGSYSGDNVLATTTELNLPRGVALDGNGNIYFADYDNHRVRKINTSGIITTIAGNGTNGFSGDGAAATAAQLSLPTGVAVSRSGNIYISDIGNAAIRKVNTSGLISIAVNGVGSVFSFSVDDSDNIYYADESSGNVWKSDSSGIKTLLLTGLNHPFDVGLDKFHNIYIANSYGNTINKITASGVMTVIAGNGFGAGAGGGYSGDGGSATAATLNFPSGVAVDTNGNIYIAEFYNQRIRKVHNPLSVTSVNNFLPSIEIYPNPTKDEINIKSTEKIVNVEIISIVGQIIFNRLYSSNKVQINLENLPTGMYFIKVNNRCAQKFVKE